MPDVEGSGIAGPEHGPGDVRGVRSTTRSQRRRASTSPRPGASQPYSSIPSSHPTSIVVGVGAIVTWEGRILLVQRGHPPMEGAWSIPGGRVEIDETLPQAVHREILEECALDVTVGDVAIILDRITRAADGSVVSHYLIIDFWATAAHDQVRARSDARDIGWFTLDQIRQLPTTTNLVQYLEEALRRRATGLPGCLVVSDWGG